MLATGSVTPGLLSAGGQSSCSFACSSSPRSWPQSPAHPTLVHFYRPFAWCTNSRRATRTCFAAYSPASSAWPQTSRDLCPSSRSCRAAHSVQSAHAGPTQGTHGRLSRRSHPRPDGAVSRELGVNSPEWRLEACSPRKLRYPGPAGLQLETVAVADWLSAWLPIPLGLLLCGANGAQDLVFWAGVTEASCPRWRRNEERNESLFLGHITKDHEV